MVSKVSAREEEERGERREVKTGGECFGGENLEGIDMPDEEAGRYVMR